MKSAISGRTLYSFHALQLSPMGVRCHGLAFDILLFPRKKSPHFLSHSHVRKSIDRPLRWFHLSSRLSADGSIHDASTHNASNRSKRASSRNSTDKTVTNEELSHYEREVTKKTQQVRTPWHREGADKAPVYRARSASAMTKGKLLTTPSRLFKMILPLVTQDVNKDRKDVEPLALLVHPQQPLSYLERLIQSELPLVEKQQTAKDGTTIKTEAIPRVDFWAVDSLENADSNVEGSSQSGEQDISSISPQPPRSSQGKDEDNANEEPFVRWSKSTEIGDFIRDAARGREFVVSIEGAPQELRVGVPSFAERTYYLRMRLRKTASQLADMTKLKQECDHIAHRSAQRVAWAGFGGMTAWGGVVAWLTFETDLGWDVMEPVTYLVGLVGLLGGYGWFLLNRREATYSSALNYAVSRRQSQMYEAKGFDYNKWQYLVDQGNTLRREIRNIAAEYDVEWDEKMDAHDPAVIEALKQGRRGERNQQREDEKKEDEAGDSK